MGWYYINKVALVFLFGHQGTKFILLLELKIVSFAVFWPSEAGYDRLVLNTEKKSFQNRVFLCFLNGGHFWPPEAKKSKKTLFRGPKNPFFCRFLATRGQI